MKPTKEPGASRFSGGFFTSFSSLRSSTAGPRNEDVTAIEEISVQPRFGQAIDQLAEELKRPREAVLGETKACLREMAATHNPVVVKAWNRLGRWLTRAYALEADPSALTRLRELDRAHTLAWLPSHRSYLDAWVLPQVLERGGFSPPYGMGGINLDFWPFGTLARRTGMVFIRRSIQDDPVYRLALRHYIAHLVHQHADFAWAIEGGRTRTGKLRPPRYGLLRYLVDGSRTEEGADVLLIPVSIVYDQLHEVAEMTAEARGAAKQPENLAWLVRFARQQGRRLGHVYVDFGEPIPLRARLAELERDAQDGGHSVERVALEVCHGINRATPITLTAVVTLALLAADRALTLAEVLATLEPMAHYVERRGHPMAGGANPRDPAGVGQALVELARSGVVTHFDGGTETVWGIQPGQHLVAAFYRNTAIHMLANRAIAELALLAAIEEAPGGDRLEQSWQAALRLRDLLKFEFFFSRRREFLEEMRRELVLIDPDWERLIAESSENLAAHARSLLEQARPHLAHLVLRPFLEAYLVVAERLAARDPQAPIDEERFLAECLGVAEQWHRQRRLASAESVSLESFRTALRLAGHRRLLGTGAADLVVGRQAFVAELRDGVRRVATIGELARLTRQVAA